MAEKNESMFINVDFKNHPDLFNFVQEEVASIPDMDRSTYMRRLVRREMRRKIRRQQDDSPTPKKNGIELPEAV